MRERIKVDVRVKYYDVTTCMKVLHLTKALRLPLVTINDEEYLDDVNYRWIKIGANAVGLETRNITTLNMHKGLRKLRRFYFGDEDIQPKHLQNITDLYSDAWFISGLHQTIKYHSKHAPIYPYVFTKKGALGLANLLGHFDRPGNNTDHAYNIVAGFKNF